jgi:hypothetical protein
MARDWEVKNWFGEGSDEAFSLRSDDERLHCSSCVLKSYRIAASLFSVSERNTEKESKEYTRNAAEKKKREEEERRKM